MSRIAVPATVQDAPAAAQASLEAVHKKLGVVPNMFRLIATSPPALEGYLAMSGALARGSITPAVAERIALAVAEVDGRDYACRPTRIWPKISPSWTMARSPPTGRVPPTIPRPTLPFALPPKWRANAGMSAKKT
jgi:hypothetical protein